MRHKDFDELGAQALELILFDQFVKVRGQQLKDETEMVAMDKRISEAKNMMFVAWITGLVQLQRGEQNTRGERRYTPILEWSPPSCSD